MRNDRTINLEQCCWWKLMPNLVVSIAPLISTYQVIPWSYSAAKIISQQFSFVDSPSTSKIIIYSRRHPTHNSLFTYTVESSVDAYLYYFFKVHNEMYMVESDHRLPLSLVPSTRMLHSTLLLLIFQRTQLLPPISRTWWRKPWRNSTSWMITRSQVPLLCLDLVFLMPRRKKSLPLS